MVPILEKSRLSVIQNCLRQVHSPIIELTCLNNRLPMISTINLPETTDQLTELIQRVQVGEEILLAQNGVAIARLIPIQTLSQPRLPGQDKGKVIVSPDFNAPLPESILNDFSNSNVSNT